MKERFLNIFLFLFSLAFIIAGVILLFFNNNEYLSIARDYLTKTFNNPKLEKFFIEMFGSFILGWGIFFFLMTIFTVMDLKSKKIYSFMFWVYTFWAVSFGYVLYRHNYFFLLIGLGIIYGIIFLPFFLSLFMKTSNQGQS